MCAKYLYSNYVQENGSEIPYQKNKGQGFKKGKRYYRLYQRKPIKYIKNN